MARMSRASKGRMEDLFKNMLRVQRRSLKRLHTYSGARRSFPASWRRAPPAIRLAHLVRVVSGSTRYLVHPP